MQRYWMTDGTNDLDLMVEDGTDLEGAFDAICNDTGERLRVRGWMITDLETMEG